MIYAVYFFRNYGQLMKAKEKLKNFWKVNDIKIGADVHELRTSEWIYGMVISPIEESIDPSRFIHLVSSAIGFEPNMIVDALPHFSNATYTNTWRLGYHRLDQYMD